MTAKRRIYPTGRTFAGYQVVTTRHRRGFLIIGPDGRVAFTRPQENTGRPVPAYVPTIREALTIAASIAEVYGRRPR